MATPILAPIVNSFSTHFTAEDLNTLQVLCCQLNALENAISNASSVEQTESLRAIQTIAVLVRLNFDDFREEIETRFETEQC